MTKYLLKYRINKDKCAEYTKFFSTRSLDGYLKNIGSDIKIIGRWNTVGESSGYCICEATSCKSINNFLLVWSQRVNFEYIECYPVLDDNQARKIILGEEPDYKIYYGDKIETEPKNEEGTYV